MSTTISIAGLDKASVLMALYARAKPFGMGFLHFKPGQLDRAEAEQLVGEQSYFDYLKGRLMKVDLSGDELHVGLYERDNGAGSARSALEAAGLIAKETAT